MRQFCLTSAARFCSSVFLFFRLCLCAHPVLAQKQEVTLSLGYRREYVFEIDLVKKRVCRSWSAGAEFPIHLNSDVGATQISSTSDAAAATPLSSWDASAVFRTRQSDECAAGKPLYAAVGSYQCDPKIRCRVRWETDLG